MPAPRTREETSAGGVVFRLVEGEPRYLLIRDSYKNWGFPKGHLKRGEAPEEAALRETCEETGLTGLALRGTLGAIEWWFRFRGRRIHKRCHFFLIESAAGETSPQRAEGITECEFLSTDEALARLSYANARDVLHRAVEMVAGMGHRASAIDGQTAG
jgi:8-oxo-dGTP pyrophosphatase MutT (NUDIX family)